MTSSVFVKMVSYTRDPVDGQELASFNNCKMGFIFSMRYGTVFLS